MMLAAGVAVAAGLYYLRETRSLDSPLAYVLPSLRSIALAMTIMTLAGPVWHRETTIGTLGRVVFAIDQSASMSIDDSSDGDGLTRYQTAIADLVDEQFGSDELTEAGSNSNLIDQLREMHQVEVLTFSSGEPNNVLVGSTSVQALASRMRQTSADGTQTDLAIPQRLRWSVEKGDETGGGNGGADGGADGGTDAGLTAIVILSDGRDTSNLGANRQTPLAEDASIVVHAIGYGDASEPVDFGIDSVTHPETVSIDSSMVGSINLKRSGIETDLEVSITQNDQVVWSKIVRPSEDGRVNFEIDVASLLDKDAELRDVRRDTRVFDLVASVRPSGDSIAKNNNKVAANDEFGFRVSASIRDRKLLILDGSVRWETRYLRNLFDRDPTWNVTTLLFGPGTDVETIKRGSDDDQMPATQQRWNQFDAIVLGEVPPEQLSAGDVEFIREFVLRGGGLIVLDGQYGRLARIAARGTTNDGSSIADLLPVEIAPGSPLRPTSMLPTPNMTQSPMFNLAGDESRSSLLWSSLPPPTTITKTRLASGGEIWAQSTLEDGSTVPAIATRIYGSGRVIYFASDSSWRWRYKVADQYHSRFWNATLAAVMQPPYAVSDRFTAIATDKIEYGPSDAPEIRVRLKDVDGEPLSTSTVDAILSSDGKFVATIALSQDDPKRGTFRGRGNPLPAGRYDISVQASGVDRRQLTATTPIWFSDETSSEWSRLSLDSENLKLIASRHRGTYLPHNQIEKLADLLKPISNGRRVETDIAIWQTWWWFAVILSLLAIEWTLRKVAGLV